MSPSPTRRNRIGLRLRPRERGWRSAVASPLGRDRPRYTSGPHVRPPLRRPRGEPRRSVPHLTHVDVVSVSTEVSLGRTVPASQELVQAAVAGDDDAFEALVVDRLPRTYRMALAILGSEADARDAVQDAWVSAWRQMPSLRNPERFDAWLDQIVVNACRTGLRRRRRIREIAIDETFDVEAPQPGPDHIGERDALQRAFNRLSIEQRSILVLHHLERRPLRAIAEVFGIPEGTAKSRLHTARAALSAPWRTSDEWLDSPDR